MRRQHRAQRGPRLQILLALVLAALTGAVLLRLSAQRPQESPPPPEDAPPLVREDASSPEPVPEPEPPPDPLEALLAEMTLREKICQLLVVFPTDLPGVSSAASTGEELQTALAACPVGGLLYDRTHMVSQEQVRTMLEAAQSHSKIPLLLTCDEEGGRVNRLMGTVGTTYVGPMLRYREEGPEKAAENARTIAADLRSLGFNMDLAPVADVWSNPSNQVIGDRAYSTDFQEAAELVAAAVQGFHDGGTACVLKHFPGHGDTSSDSHYGAVYVHKTLEQLRQEELLPFRSGIAAGADAVMMGHLILEEIDGQPALLSHRLVTELLREELGFDGAVITDSLRMQAMTDHYGSGEIAVGAVRAGVDLLLCPQDLDETIAALTAAIEQGDLPEARLDESVLRILRLKQNNGILALPLEQPPQDKS